MGHAGDETSITSSDRPSTEREADSRQRSVWLREGRPHRGHRPLTRARIVEEAVALLDEEGIERLTMRRLAERLGTGSTTLYWHVATKDDVLDLTLDALFGEVPLPPRGDDWRADLRTLILAWRTAMLRHPWAVSLLGRPLLGPNTLARVEFVQSTLLRAGLTGDDLAAATWTLCSQVMGAASTQAGFHLSPADRHAAHTHLLAHRNSYPTLAAHGYMHDEDCDTAFATGLDYLLDGITATTHR
ncbi:TetR/AcrR family transcriptional regulator [Streptomyces sp. NBC_01803]|uniref:TetR/AcrR family transcriptional regulator n=1 Tax=Streptomyces sp. NBC_01803 TaxID=2975946 RepID=UPI002DDBEECF|nr:TetR/AcrR family transcriptional regulator C-terminal domain-containing protein [Streptomyces sp. NBC_01803]WSA45538.1 TetR/AcrR family transcriptional regulator C-terminal domain-containing protein [Streptomyces sp. NBC_01803]